MESDICYIKFRHDECLRFFHEFRSFWKLCQPIPLLQRDFHHTYFEKFAWFMSGIEHWWTYIKHPIYLYLIFWDVYLVHELDFWTLSISSLIFTVCVACKNLVKNEHKIKSKNKLKNQDRELHCKCFDHKDYRDWKLREPAGKVCTIYGKGL